MSENSLGQEDLRFIAETRKQVQSIYEAFRAGRLPVTRELVAALSQTREQLMTIRLDGSVDPAAADQRISVCMQIAQIVREAQAEAPTHDPVRSNRDPWWDMSDGATVKDVGSELDETPIQQASPWAPVNELYSLSEPAASALSEVPPRQSSQAPDHSWHGPAQTSATDLRFAHPGAGYAFPPIWASNQGPGSGSRGRSRRIVSAVSAVVLALLAATGGYLITSGGSRTGWADPSLQVVGSPVAADRAVVVLDVSADRQLQLAAVNPKNGATIWTTPFSASGITPGVAFGPTVLGNTVLELTPAAGPDDPSVTIEGLSATTGKVIWSLSQPIVVSDAPAVCGGDFCIAAFLSQNSTALALLDPVTGRIVGAAKGPSRNMTVSQPGSSNTGGLWETSDTTPTLEQVSAAGQILWSKTVASVFGGPQYDPNYGWDFLTQGNLDVGSVGAAPTGSTITLDGLKTVAVSLQDGTTKWSDPGDFMCGGGLQFLSADVICKYTGTATESGSSVDMSGVGVTLEGLNPSSGAITWSLPVKGAQSLSLGTGVAFADSTHLVVTQLTGQRVLLNVTTGSLSQLKTNEVFWCEQSPMYSLNAGPGSSAGDQRQSSPVFNGCTSDGQSVKASPNSSPNTVGTVAEGMFVWPTSHGLRATSQAG